MNLWLLCLKIFFIRMTDVTLGTIRTIVMVKGNRVVASIIGFIEVLVWFSVVKEALNTVNQSFFIAIFYAAGFSVGTLLGSLLSSKFIKGNLGVQIITSQKNEKMISLLRKNKYAVSVINVEGHDTDEEKYMLFIEIHTSQLDHLKSLIRQIDQHAFVVVNETKYVQNGYFYGK